MRSSGDIAFAAATAGVVAASAAVAIGAILGIGAASAADIPPRTFTKAPTIGAEVYGWSGLYFGGNVGALWASGTDFTNFHDTGRIPGFFDNTRTTPIRNTAAIGGIHAGYNWQMARWVLGVEADFDWTGRKTEFCRQPNVAFDPSSVASIMAADFWFSRTRRNGLVQHGDVWVMPGNAS